MNNKINQSVIACAETLVCLTQRLFSLMHSMRKCLATSVSSTHNVTSNDVWILMHTEMYMLHDSQIMLWACTSYNCSITRAAGNTCCLCSLRKLLAFFTCHEVVNGEHRGFKVLYAESRLVHVDRQVILLQTVGQ